ARVARRAFAGDPGERFTEPRLVMDTAYSSTMTATSAPDERNMRFVLSLTAAAAVLLVVLSVAIRGLSLPSSSNMLAEPKVTIEDARRQLDVLNQHPAAADTAAQKAPETRK